MNVKKRISVIVSVWLLTLLLSGYASVGGGEGESYSVREIPVYVDGCLDHTGYWIEDTVYVPLRSFCGGLDLGATAAYHPAGETMSVSMHHEESTYLLTARVGDVYLYINDRIVYLEQQVISHRGNVLVPVQGLARGFGVTADMDDAGLHLHSDTLKLCKSGSEVYDPTDLKWLSHIINAEAGNQSLEGQICVGNVVLNRVADARFPDTVQGVIFSPNQFCPVKSGTVYCTPDADAVAAAKLCLEGVNLAGESLYFVNPVTGSTAWFRENLTYAMTVGDHDFYF